MQESQPQSTLGLSVPLLGDRLIKQVSLIKATEKTLTTSSPYRKVERISCLILALFPNIKIEVLAEIRMALLNATMERPN
jgi:hypothetical protein